MVVLSVGLGVLFALGTHIDVSKEVSERGTDGVGNGKGRVLGVGQGYLEETGTMSKDYTPPVHISNADTNGEPTPPPHHRHERPERTNEEKRRVIGISACTCTTLYLTSRLPQIWKNVSASRLHHSLDPDTCIQQYTRKSAKGLSLALFAFAFLGNLFYVLSILSLFSTPHRQLKLHPHLHYQMQRSRRRPCSLQMCHQAPDGYPLQVALSCGSPYLTCLVRPGRSPSIRAALQVEGATACRGGERGGGDQGSEAGAPACRCRSHH